VNSVASTSASSRTCTSNSATYSGTAVASSVSISQIDLSTAFGKTTKRRALRPARTAGPKSWAV
jgi:hypothetical protein